MRRIHHPNTCLTDSASPSLFLSLPWCSDAHCAPFREWLEGTEAVLAPGWGGRAVCTSRPVCSLCDLCVATAQSRSPFFFAPPSPASELGLGLQLKS
jgi:hypothetical protein